MSPSLSGRPFAFSRGIFCLPLARSDAAVSTKACGSAPAAAAVGGGGGARPVDAAQMDCTVCAALADWLLASSLHCTLAMAASEAGSPEAAVHAVLIPRSCSLLSEVVSGFTSSHLPFLLHCF
jgi:hypothetical protein